MRELTPRKIVEEFLLEKNKLIEFANNLRGDFTKNLGEFIDDSSE